MTDTWVQPTPLVVLDEFLAPQEWAGLLKFALRNNSRYASSGILGAGGEEKNDRDYRRSLVLYELGGLQDWFAQRIQSYLPHVLARLHMPPFPIARFEIQLTATTTVNSSASTKTTTPKPCAPALSPSSTTSTGNPKPSTAEHCSSTTRNSISKEI